jgi:NAD(P)H dehydrogenase (quinone)
MHTLIILAHPNRQSFTGALADALARGLGAAGHAIELADLYREAGEWRFQPEDFAQFHGAAMPADVLREQARVDRAEALAFVFPIWWWSFPAILKGWIERVFSDGWAYSFEPGLSRGRLQDRPTLLLGVAGSRESTYRKYGYGAAMQTQIDTGILGYCGLRDVTTRFFYDVEQSPELRARYLAEAETLAGPWLAPDRAVRVPPWSSDRPA